MSIKFLSHSTWILCAFIFMSGARAQDYATSRWMELYNKGDYTAAIEEIPQWLQTVPDPNKGIPLYFLGESYYNLALVEKNATRAISYFRNALTNLNESLTRADLRVSNSKHTAAYRKGWAQFRLAELGADKPDELFKGAYNAFDAVERQAPQELLVESAYMAGEARLRQAQMLRYQVLSQQTMVSDVNNIVGLLNEAAQKFRQVVDPQNTLNELKPAAQIRLSDVYYEYGKVYQGLTQDIFAQVSDQNKKSDAAATVKDYLAKAGYENVANLMTAEARKTAQSALIYSEAMKLLDVHLTQPGENSSLNFTNKIGAVAAELYRSEVLFRIGNHDQAEKELSEGPFQRLSMEGSLYARAAREIPEAYYWLGMVQSVYSSSQNAALASFNSFLERAVSTSTVRQQILREDALLRRYSLDLNRIMQLDQSRSKLTQLEQLEKSISDFSPQVTRVQRQKDDLLANVRLSKEIISGGNRSDDEIAGQIYRNILNGNIDLAIGRLNELLPQAASTTDLSRASYLKILRILALILEEQRKDESLFYRGIITSLEAEISPTASEKQNLFRTSAKYLQSVGDKYKDEARYIRGRSLFYAGDYDEAVDVLTKVVNETQSLRALYFLGEYFREQENGVAAKKCYDTIKQKTESGSYWFRKADASISLLTTSAGDERPLRGIAYANVKFPDATVFDNANKPLYYEGLADYNYLRTKLAQEAKELLMQFGLPKRSLYPSQNRIAHSMLLSEPTFSEIVVPIDDRPSAINSGLRLVLIPPVGINAESFQVSLNEQPLTATAGVYMQDQIQLNSTAVIKVSKSGFYPFISAHTFVNPGVDSVFVVPTKELKFSGGRRVDFENAVFLNDRLDKNIILPRAVALSPKSTLYKEIAQNPSVRDYAYHPELKAFLVVDAKNNRILQLADNATLDQGLEFSMESGDGHGRLDSPEGIAVDSDGNIYIADWGNHRILAVDKNKKLIRSIGTYGANNVVGDPAKLIYPTRIAVGENPQGISHNGKTVKTERYLFVADRNGVSLLDERGHFLDSVISATTSPYPAGDFYGLATEGYGEKFKIYLANRQRGEIQLFEANE